MMTQDLQDTLLDLLVRRADTAVTAAGMVDWATSALAAGSETPALVVLAGLPRESSLFEADPWLQRALAELHITVPPTEQLRRAYVGAVSRAVLAGRLTCEEALDRVHLHAVGPLGHPPDLASWCYVWEGLGPVDFRDLRTQADEEARDLAREWAMRPTLVHPTAASSGA